MGTDASTAAGEEWRNPNQRIRAAVVYALANGCTLRKSAVQAHIWGRLYCPLGTRDGYCGSGDRLWEGSLRMRSLSRHPIVRRRPHLHQTCAFYGQKRHPRPVRSRRVCQGAPTRSVGREAVPDRGYGKCGACAGKVHVPIRGGLESRSGSRLYAESRSRVGKPARRFQQSAEAIVRTRHTPLAAGRAEP